MGAAVKCEGCGRFANPEKDWCYGCYRIICVQCSFDGGHHYLGLHLPRPRRLKTRARGRT